jgi:Amt family ammonium transporter
MFAAITPALITGPSPSASGSPRFVVFTILWSIFVYSPIAHWVWASDGWLFQAGALDFAGGTVVHASSGVSALIVALLIGKRVVNGDRMEPHDIPMTVLGAGLLWFGWFGFNAGSELGADGIAANALWSPTPRPPQQRSPGCSRAISTTARSASSAPRVAPWPASSQSRRHPAS